MAAIDHGNMRVYTTSWQKLDGSPGEIQAGTQTWELSDETFAAMLVSPDGATAKVKHSGVLGPDAEVTLSTRADGNLGEGPDEVKAVALSLNITMKAALGAEGGILAEGEQVPADF